MEISGQYKRELMGSKYYRLIKFDYSVYNCHNVHMQQVQKHRIQNINHLLLHETMAGPENQ